MLTLFDCIAQISAIFFTGFRHLLSIATNVLEILNVCKATKLCQCLISILKRFHVNLAKRIYFRTVLPGRYGKNGHRAQLSVAEECNHAEGNV